MSSEPDLYPPDIEVVTKDIKTARDRAVIGTFLVTLGSGLMLERAFDNNLDYFWLAVGLGILAGWLQAPRFIWFAVGSIMTGFAVGGFLQSLIAAPFESTIGFLFAAAGFFAVYARYPRTAKWAIIPAALFGLFAVGATGVELIGFIPSAITGMMLPLFLIAGGALLLFRNSLPRNFVKGGLVVLAIMFVGSAASTVDKWDTDPDFDFDFRGTFGTHEYTSELPELAGRQLVVETDSGEVELFTTAEGATGSAKARTRAGSRQGIRVEQDDDTVRLSLGRAERGPFLGIDNSASWVITVPDDSLVRVSTENGLVKGVLAGGDVEIETDDGAVQLTVQAGLDRLDVESENGAVQLIASETALALQLESDNGAILVDGEPCDSPCERPNDGPDVTVSTDNGQIIVVDQAA